MISANEWIQTHQERWNNFSKNHEVYPDMFHVEGSNLICNNSIISNSMLEDCILYNTTVISSSLKHVDANSSNIKQSELYAYCQINNANILHSCFDGGGLIKIAEIANYTGLSTLIEYTNLNVGNGAEIVIERSNLIATSLDVYYETKLNIEKHSSIWHTNGYITKETTIKKFSRIHKAVIDGGGVISHIITVSGLFVEKGDWMLSIINDEENVKVSIGCHVMTPKQWERVIEEECRAHGINVTLGKAIKMIAKNIVEVITHKEFFE